MEELSAELLGEHTVEAKKRIRQMILQAEQQLSGRLYALARSSLPSLRNVGYEDVLRSFASELPRAEWRTVRVNPVDTALAQALFPGACIEPDANISGGLIAETAEREVSVDNTFERRLERAWEGMLPEILNDVKEFSASVKKPASTNKQAPSSK